MATAVPFPGRFPLLFKDHQLVEADGIPFRVVELPAREHRREGRVLVGEVPDHKVIELGAAQYMPVKGCPFESNTRIPTLQPVRSRPYVRRRPDRAAEKGFARDAPCP